MTGAAGGSKALPKNRSFIHRCDGNNSDNVCVCTAASTRYAPAEVTLSGDVGNVRAMRSTAEERIAQACAEPAVLTESLGQLTELTDHLGGKLADHLGGPLLGSDLASTWNRQSQELRSHLEGLQGFADRVCEQTTALLRALAFTLAFLGTKDECPQPRPRQTLAGCPELTGPPAPPTDCEPVSGHAVGLAA